ncbi:MAG: OB-fold domain-containing protein [Planctomycetota bacterium]
MIAQIEGKLTKLDTDCCLVQVGAVGYEVMLPSYCVSALSGQVGSDIVLCTMEYYEGTPGGGNLVPRMIGFLSSGERDFFTKYTSVKGMGIKKGLRSLSIPIATIAAAIENADDKTLMSLPAENDSADYRRVAWQAAGLCRRGRAPGGDRFGISAVPDRGFGDSHRLG